MVLRLLVFTQFTFSKEILFIKKLSKISNIFFLNLSSRAGLNNGTGSTQEGWGGPCLPAVLWFVIYRVVHHTGNPKIWLSARIAPETEVGIGHPKFVCQRFSVEIV